MQTSKTSRSTPAQMWLAGQINHYIALDSTLNLQQDHDDSEDKLGGNEEQLHGNRPVFLPLLPELSDACLLELNSLTLSDANHGIDDFVRALYIIIYFFYIYLIETNKGQ